VTTAVSLVRNNISGGISGNAGDYADQVAVLNQAGLTNEAQTLLATRSCRQAVRRRSWRAFAMAM
jgi:hypothetical protein